MALYATDFSEFTAGAASTKLTGFTVQQVGTWSSTIVDLGGGVQILRHAAGASGNDLVLVTYDAFETTGPVEALTKIRLASTSDQNAPVGPALIAPDGRLYGWRANTTPTATTWRLAQFTATGSVSASIGTAATFTEAAAGTDWCGRNEDDEIYGSLWLDGAGRPGSPMAGPTANTTLTTVKPGLTSMDSSDDPFDFRWFGAATEGDTAPETAGGSPIDIAGAVDALVIAEHAAAVKLGKLIDAGADPLVIAEFIATVRQSRLIATGFDPLTITELQATTTIGHAFSAGVDALALQEHAATLGLQAPGLNVAKTFRYPSALLRM